MTSKSSEGVVSWVRNEFTKGRQSEWKPSSSERGRLFCYARPGSGRARTLFIESERPWENQYVESFSGKLRDESLNREILANLREAQAVIEAWPKHYNAERPHSSLDNMTPEEFANHSVARHPLGDGHSDPDIPTGTHQPHE